MLCLDWTLRLFVPPKNGDIPRSFPKLKQDVFLEKDPKILC